MLSLACQRTVQYYNTVNPIWKRHCSQFLVTVTYIQYSLYCNRHTGARCVYNLICILCTIPMGAAMERELRSSVLCLRVLLCTHRPIIRIAPTMAIPAMNATTIEILSIIGSDFIPSFSRVSPSVDNLVLVIFPPPSSVVVSGSVVVDLSGVALGGKLPSLVAFI